MTALAMPVALVGTVAKTGIPRAFGVLQLLVGLLAAATTDVSGFLPGVADPFNVLLTAMIYLAPLAAATGAAHAGVFQRSGMGAVAAVTVGGTHAAAILNWAGAAVWSLITYLGMLTVVCLRAEVTGSTTPAMFTLVVLAVTLLLAMAAIGTAVATVRPHPLMAPTLAITSFVGLYVVSYATGPWAVLSPTSPGTTYQPYFEPRTALVLTQAAALAGAAVTAWAAVHRGLRRILHVASGTAMVLVAAVGLWHQAPPHPDLVAIGLGPDAPVQPRTPPEDPACGSRDGVTLCVWPESAEQLDHSLAALAPIQAAASPYLDVPGRYAQPGVGVPGETYHVPEAGMTDHTFYAVPAALPDGCMHRAALQATFDLRAWLSHRLGARVATPRIRKAAGLPREEQQAWVDHRLAKLSACSG